jgi:LAS superfamily LD-carboxypeptidase LdcB
MAPPKTPARVAPTLGPLELTGRATTHVRDVPELECRLHVDVAEPAARLRVAAAAAGIDLAIVSSFRDFDRQVGIWNGKFRGERPLLDIRGQPLDAANLDESARVEAILLWSALPGASRHHWGTDIDVIDRAAVPPHYRPQLTIEEYTGNGPFAPLNDWLAANLGDHGFFRPYTTDLGGVHPEPWHLSYAPVSRGALNALTLDVLREAIETSELLGREQVLARLPAIYSRYVIAIDPA